jgi:hypothetical protein
MARNIKIQTPMARSARLWTGIVLSAALFCTAFAGTANADGYDRGRHDGRYQGRQGHAGDWGGGGGYYVAPPVVYGGGYYAPYYYPPPVVYAPGIGISLPGINIGIQ